MLESSDCRSVEPLAGTLMVDGLAPKEQANPSPPMHLITDEEDCTMCPSSPVRPPQPPQQRGVQVQHTGVQRCLFQGAEHQTPFRNLPRLTVPPPAPSSYEDEGLQLYISTPKVQEGSLHTKVQQWLDEMEESLSCGIALSRAKQPQCISRMEGLQGPCPFAGALVPNGATASLPAPAFVLMGLLC